MLQTIIQNQEQKFYNLTKEISNFKLQNLKIQRTNTDIHNWVEFSTSMYEEMRTKIDTREKHRKDDLEYISAQEQKVIVLRNSILELRNIPAQDRKTTNDLISTMCSVGSTIGVKISYTELRDTYRIPSKPGTHKIDFASVQKRDSFLLKA